MTHETKKLLILSAKQLLLTEGIGSLSVEKICAEAGVSKGGFFHHFQSRDEFLKALLAYFTQMQQELFQHCLQSDTLDFGKGLRAYLTATLTLSGEAKENAKATCRCLIEILFSNPKLLATEGLSSGFYQPLIELGTSSGMSYEQTLLILLATEGLWYDQSLQVMGIKSAQVDHIVHFLINLTKTSMTFNAKCARSEIAQ